uniref:NADH-ubiquinone oxidoreductase chain 2 n=1 Tax=Rubiconia intermedia TaxID=763267 RepID=A0A0H3VKZ5_9HEMI|nr:NADH dehydrogenase subunit 2 [Rubiconia intermedia]
MKKSTWIYIFTMIAGTMITLSSKNWISMWMGLELNLMSFIPIMLNKSNKSSAEAAMIYFLMQSMGSMLLLMSVMMLMSKYSIENKMNNIIITVSLLMKLGAAPFHLWMPEVMSKINWYKGAILMTWQKMAPLMMMSNIMYNHFILNLAILSSVVLGGLGGINQTSLRKLMGYSSINHLGWMLSINKFMNLWMAYFAIYSALVLMICQTFHKMKMYFLNQLQGINMDSTEKINLFVMMLSMGGLPPFIGFLPKWITMQAMINSKEMMIMFVMIMFSLITLMFYLRIMTNMYLTFNSTIKWSYIKSNKASVITMMMMNLSLPLILIMDMI